MRPSDLVMSQLSDFNAWSSTGPQQTTISLIDYVGFVGTPDLLFGFAALFWPDLIIHQGLHFLASGFSVATYEQWQSQGFTSREIQRVMNHVHVATLFQNQHMSDEMAVETARMIATIWSRTIGPDGLTSEALGDTFDNAAATFFELEASDKEVGQRQKNNIATIHGVP